MRNESSLAITNLWSTNTGGETRSFRDGAFSIKLLALIDQLVFGFVDILAGTGRTTELRAGEDNTVMTHEDEDLVIDSPLDWVFAFEGGAHILFRNTSSNPVFDGKLLRLAKCNKHTLPILKKHQAVQDTFLPLLTPDNGEQLVVHTDLVKVGRHVLEVLQSEQVQWHTKRESELDLEETHGTLLEDLSADPSILLLDFKPKWLSQSPTAPRDANTCRTCALRRLRRKTAKSRIRFCPLDLASGRYHRVHRAVTALLYEKNMHHEAVSVEITKHLMISDLIPTLLKAQTSPDSSLATRMTLRDCTLFIQIPRELYLTSPEGASQNSEVDNTSNRRLANGFHKCVNRIAQPRPIRIIIADLDEKSEENRGEYWKTVENNLIEGGYYLGAGKLDVMEEECDLRDDIAWTSSQIQQNGTH